MRVRKEREESETKKKDALCPAVTWMGFALQTVSRMLTTRESWFNAKMKLRMNLGRIKSGWSENPL